MEVHVRLAARAAKAATLPGIGPTTASALVASVGEFGQLANARHFGAWRGLVPSQNSTGGKARLADITKRGGGYLRTLLIQGPSPLSRAPANAATALASGWCNSKSVSAGRRQSWRWPTRTRASCGQCSRAMACSTQTMCPRDPRRGKSRNRYELIL